MNTIKAYDGRVCNLSDEIYVLEGFESAFEDDHYQNGTRVRLISGVDGSPIPGYHFSKGYVTVCSVEAKVAEFRGCKRSQIRRDE